MRSRISSENSLAAQRRKERKEKTFGIKSTQRKGKTKSPPTRKRTEKSQSELQRSLSEQLLLVFMNVFFILKPFENAQALDRVGFIHFYLNFIVFLYLLWMDSLVWSPFEGGEGKEKKNKTAETSKPTALLDL